MINRRFIQGTLFLSILIAITLSFDFGRNVTATNEVEVVSAETTVHRSPLGPGPCYATHDYGQTVEESVDASAVQTAIDAAPAGGTVKVAGTCIGVQPQMVPGGTISQTVYISKTLTLQGGHTPSDWSASPNSSLYPTVLDANGQGRVVVLHDAAESGTMKVTLNRLTLQNGMADGSPGPFDSSGGGLYIDADIDATVSNSTLSSNSADFGGGIYNRGDATVSMSNSTFSGNWASLSGGGILNRGDATVSNSTLSDNSARGNGGGIFNLGQVMVSNSTLSGNSAYNGGGISNNNGTATVRTSTLSGNSAVDGSGIYNLYGTVTVSNSTLSDNSATYSGGGIFNIGNGTATVSNSTISGNLANSGGGGGIYSSGIAMVRNSTLSGNSAYAGGGIYNPDNGTATVSNSIVALNLTGGDCVDITTFTNSLDGDDSCGSGGADAIEAAHLGLLQDNGGATHTHALLVTSPDNPAINMGNNASCPATDQRGYLRHDGLCDIGAYEVQRHFVWLPIVVR